MTEESPEYLAWRKPPTLATAETALAAMQLAFTALGEYPYGSSLARDAMVALRREIELRGGTVDEGGAYYLDNPVDDEPQAG